MQRTRWNVIRECYSTRHRRNGGRRTYTSTIEEAKTANCGRESRGERLCTFKVSTDVRRSMNRSLFLRDYMKIK